MAVRDPVSLDRPGERRQRDSRASIRPVAPRPELGRAGPAVSASWDRETTSSTRPHSTARCPLIPSSSVQKTSARSRLT